MGRSLSAPHGILWEGNSPLDGQPIVAIATWPKPKKMNQKVGMAAQVYILARDVAPLEAVMTGADASVCGHCPLRSPKGMVGRGCYVQIGQGPEAIWKAYKAGSYKYFPTAYFAGRGVRWGAYGDPAMLPESLVREVNMHAAFHLGYTHQWRLPFARWTRGVFMASVETAEQETRARIEGWGTFRAGRSDSSDIGVATLCANEARGTTCADCRECDGGHRSIFIPAHGRGQKNVPANRLARKKQAANG